MARGLLRRFEAYMRKRFETIGAFRVSPVAAALLDAGFRLCTGEGAAPAYDLQGQP